MPHLFGLLSEPVSGEALEVELDILEREDGEGAAGRWASPGSSHFGWWWGLAVPGLLHETQVIRHPHVGRHAQVSAAQQKRVNWYRIMLTLT